MKSICNGCDFAAQKRGMFDCPFCRTPCTGDDADGRADTLKMIQARVEKKDPAAINMLGERYSEGMYGLQKSMLQAVKLWEEAAELGSVKALFNLGVAYYSGLGVRQDEAKGAKFYKKAAVQGHAESRYRLGVMGGMHGNYRSSYRHLLISANMGHERSIALIRMTVIDGLATKEQYTEALKGYQDAVEDMKSPERDQAKAFVEEMKSPERDEAKALKALYG